jgi:hypothetical protein
MWIGKTYTGKFLKLLETASACWFFRTCYNTTQHNICFLHCRILQSLLNSNGHTHFKQAQLMNENWRLGIWSSGQCTLMGLLATSCLVHSCWKQTLQEKNNLLWYDMLLAAYNKLCNQLTPSPFIPIQIHWLQYNHMLLSSYTPNSFYFLLYYLLLLKLTYHPLSFLIYLKDIIFSSQTHLSFYKQCLPWMFHYWHGRIRYWLQVMQTLGMHMGKGCRQSPNK